jgi:signal transduction histidine kinase
LTAVVEPGLPAAYVDPERLRQVLGNLLSNALRHTPAGGRIVFSASRDEHAILLTVADTGAGIEPGDLPYVFDRFYRADHSRAEGQGESGLGLAIVRSLVEMHRGSVAVESMPGRGAIFTIRLPLA